MNYTYILECADGTYYTGYTNDIEKRIATHNAGNGAKYTRSRLPVKLVYKEEYETKSEAMKREAQIKKLTRAEKIKLITPIPEGMISTNSSVCSKCMYGSRTSCNYYLYTSKKRDCPVGLCDKFTPVDKDKKREVQRKYYNKF